MERKRMQDIWSELRDQISEWREDVINELATISDDNPEQVNMIFPTRDGYITNLAVSEIKVRMRNYNPKGERREKRFGSENWMEKNNGEYLYKSKTKAHTRSYVTKKNSL